MPEQPLRLKLVPRQPDPAPGREPAVIRVAFATDDLRHVNQHFGTTLGCVIYEVSSQGKRLVEVARFTPASWDGREDKLRVRLECVASCRMVFCNAVGGSAVRQLIRQGVKPVRVDPGASIAGLLTDLTATANRNRRVDPGDFLERRIQPREPGRMQTMLAESWDE